MSQFWQIVTASFDHTLSEAEREQSRLYAGTLFILCVPLVIFSILILFLPIIRVQFVPATIINTLIYCAFYMLCRTKYYQWGMRLAIWFAVVSLTIMFQVLPAVPLFVLNFFTVPILLAGFFFDTREAFIHLFVLLGIVMLLEFNIAGEIEFLRAPLLVLELGLLSIVAALVNRQYRQQALDNEARYRQLMEANFEGILVLDGEDAHIVDANPATSQMLGYSQDEFVGRFPVEFVVKNSKAIAYYIWENKQLNVPVEVQMLHREGYTIDVQVRMRSYQYQNRDAYVCTLINITDRKQAEALIIESEERFRAIFNGSSHYIGVMDEHGKILEFNTRAYEIFGLRPSNVLGRYLWDFDHWAHSEKSKERVREVTQAAIEGQSSRNDIQARDKDGKTIYLDFSLEPLLDSAGKTRMIVAESRDMTAYKESEAQRREFERRYETLFKNTTDAVFIIGMDGIIQDANQSAVEILRADYEKIVGSHLNQFVADDEVQQTNKLMKQLKAGEMTTNINERTMERADGSRFSAETMGIVVEDEHGQERYILSMVRDISERKRLERERLQATFDRERTELLAHFIENASHHFRTPITNMKTRMYLLSRVLEKPQKRDEQITILNQELERLQNILSDLLSVLRLQKDDTGYSLTRFSANQVVSEVRQSVEGRQEYQNYTWEWQYDDDDPMIFGDRRRFAQGIINLVENAMTYTPAGGTIQIRTFSRDDLIAIDVIDSGKGILESDLPHVFDDFYRGQDAMEDDTTSSGLGLTITKLTVKRHRGKIFVSSMKGKGTHFQIVVPADDDWTSPAQDLADEMMVYEQR